MDIKPYNLLTCSLACKCSYLKKWLHKEGDRLSKVWLYNNIPQWVCELWQTYYIWWGASMQIILTNTYSLLTQSNLYIKAGLTTHSKNRATWLLSLSWLKGEVRENLGDFRKSLQILTFLSPLLHVPLPYTKTNND